VAAGGGCELKVNLNPTQAGEQNASVTIITNNPAVPASSALLSTQSINTAAALSGVAGSTNSSVTWYSGGNRPWLANNTASGVQSGIIGNDQQSILSAFVVGKGSLSFQWSVSSEENVDDPTDPYDALYLYVNNELQTFISGEVAFESYPTITLDDDSSIITWVYRKDPATIAGDDKAYVRNVVFTPTEVTTFLPTPLTPSTGGGGGTASWLSILCLIGFWGIRRKK
jgi:hypothetical protein